MKFLSLSLMFVLTACTAAPAHDSAPAASAAATLDRYHWILTGANDAAGSRIDALFARADKPLQLDFAKGRVHVVNACNAMGGAYALADGHLRIDGMMSTMMACADHRLDALDRVIRRVLQGAPAIALTQGEAPSLELTTTQGEHLIFSGKPTAQTRYGGEGERIFLEVAAQTVPCNHPLMPGQKCLRVREVHFDSQGLKTGTPGAWHVLNQSIEGYTHEPNVRNVLRVKRFAIAHPAADAPAQAYVLDMVVESERIKPLPRPVLN
jgi:heat shock protein HslJ